MLDCLSVVSSFPNYHTRQGKALQVVAKRQLSAVITSLWFQDEHPLKGGLSYFFSIHFSDLGRAIIWLFLGSEQYDFWCGEAVLHKTEI